MKSDDDFKQGIYTKNGFEEYKGPIDLYWIEPIIGGSLIIFSFIIGFKLSLFILIR